MPGSNTLHGPDLSSFQASLDLTKTAHDFAIVKATQGDWYTNPAFATHMGQAKGGLRGAYHFWETGKPVAAQVDRFLAVVEPYLDGRTLIALDYEPGYNNDLTGASQWLALVEQRTGLCPILYLNHYYAGLGWAAEVKRCPVWLAGAPEAVYYPNALPSSVPSLPGWSVICQQWTDKGTLPGYSGGLDLNVWFGDETTWIAQATPTTKTGDWFDMATVDDLKKAVADTLSTAQIVSVGTSQWSVTHVLDWLRRGVAGNGQQLAGLKAAVDALGAKAGVDVQALYDAAAKGAADGVQAEISGAQVQVTLTAAPASNGGQAPSVA